jgi:hypothetical protein
MAGTGGERNGKDGLGMGFGGRLGGAIAGVQGSIPWSSML